MQCQKHNKKTAQWVGIIIQEVQRGPGSLGQQGPRGKSAGVVSSTFSE